MVAPPLFMAFRSRPANRPRSERPGSWRVAWPPSSEILLDHEISSIEKVRSEAALTPPPRSRGKARRIGFKSGGVDTRTLLLPDEIRMKSISANLEIEQDLQRKGFYIPRYFGAFGRLHANQAHHSAVFMFEKMTVIWEVPTAFGSRKSMRSFTRGYAGSSHPRRNVDRIAQKRLVHCKPKPFQQQEMNLMNVKRVQFLRAILDDPVFHVSLVGHDVRNVGVDRMLWASRRRPSKKM